MVKDPKDLKISGIQLPDGQIQEGIVCVCVSLQEALTPLGVLLKISATVFAFADSVKWTDLFGGFVSCDLALCIKHLVTVETQFTFDITDGRISSSTLAMMHVISHLIWDPGSVKLKNFTLTHVV